MHYRLVAYKQAIMLPRDHDNLLAGNHALLLSGKPVIE
jgi:hypothetical protein